MALNKDKVREIFRDFSRSLRHRSQLKSPKEVHDLRTGSRRVEALVHALMLDERRVGRQSLKAVRLIRRKSGKVRDMDVLADYVSGLEGGGEGDGEDECVVQLIGYLGKERLKAARKLRGSIMEHRKAARDRLKRCSSLLLHSSEEEDLERQWQSNPMVVAVQLFVEVSDWPRLTRANMHSYRLKVKELYYILQMVEGSNAKLVGRLGEVKDAIGEWHDWSELQVIAAQVLDHAPGCKVLQHIRTTVSAKLHRALLLTNEVRRECLGGEDRP